LVAPGEIFEVAMWLGTPRATENLLLAFLAPAAGAGAPA